MTHGRAAATTLTGRLDQRSSLFDAKSRPLPYHGRVRVSRPFTDALGRALNPCKVQQCGMYCRGARFALVLDLVDAEWTRCPPPSGFRISREADVRDDR